MAEMMSRSRVGRVVLHIGALLRDRKAEWHLKGIRREFAWV